MQFSPLGRYLSWRDFMKALSIVRLNAEIERGPSAFDRDSLRFSNPSIAAIERHEGRRDA